MLPQLNDNGRASLWPLWNEAFFKPKQALLSWYMLFFQLRGIADYIVKRDDFAFIRWLWRVWSPNWQIEESIITEVIDTLRQPGVQRGALSFREL